MCKIRFSDRVVSRYMELWLSRHTYCETMRDDSHLRRLALAYSKIRWEQNMAIEAQVPSAIRQIPIAWLFAAALMEYGRQHGKEEKGGGLHKAARSGCISMQATNAL